MKKKYFEGWYFKHQIDNQTVAFIIGSTKAEAFIQVITDKKSYHYNFLDIKVGTDITIGGCKFSKKGIDINLENIKGKIYYDDFAPLKNDIMGPFKFLPMECRHAVISMCHKLRGWLIIDGEKIVFDGGKGYIEKDSGNSFPKDYTWLATNSFKENLSIMVAIANIPLIGTSFTGCIVSIFYNNVEYRIATYNGVKILKNTQKEIVLAQGKLLFSIKVIDKPKGYQLKAPIKGEMSAIVKECNRAVVHFRLWENKRLVFDTISRNTSLEYFNKKQMYD